ncbi:hypothetical protein PR202_gb06667 [Eleusine coracana subsp. coracana]|uniref:Phytocyanin domain-containing protein n=1 Tax=Eleusine coracana subsp. coracana TaxID=191504 RepID=A0AAV5EA82_ELECO|nr:hypothetical protein QOZ80_2BG0160570 [Eleusine coracana subsp. coracana]GJN19392.1 hypothetical protein PR202_gb06667 [Eleusine coracana subsp. coracana]
MAAAKLVRVSALAVAVVLVALPTVAAATHEAKRFKVGGADGWRVPPPEVKEMYYANWASRITFYVGDFLEFVFKNDSVIQVDKAGYYHCNFATAALRDGHKTFRLTAPGNAYFTSADVDRCKMGERLMIDVLAADHPAAPGPWMPAPGPSSSAAAVAYSVHTAAVALVTVAAGLL